MAARKKHTHKPGDLGYDVLLLGLLQPTTSGHQRGVVVSDGWAWTKKDVYAWARKQCREYWNGATLLVVAQPGDKPLRSFTNRYGRCVERKEV